MVYARLVPALLLLLTACPKGEPGSTEGETGASESTTANTPTDASSTANTPTESGGTSVCHEACVHLTACGNDLLAPSMSGCVSLCESSALIDTEWCRTAAQDWYACLTDAPCDQTDPGPSGVCAVAFADYNVSCVPCSASIEPDTADRCFATAECTGGFAVTFACEGGDTCSCLLDGDEFASCPAASTCAGDDAAIQAAAEACCEMPFTPAKPIGA